jgi:signal transduction histidine kinase
MSENQFRQLFYNLIDNSIKHGGHTTKISIYFEIPNADKLNLIYEDNGKGISSTQAKTVHRRIQHHRFIRTRLVLDKENA